MEQKFKIFVKSKNADLVALTSESVIKDLLEFAPLMSLRRFIYWEVGFHEPDYLLAQEKLARILNQSFYLVNPNKEFFEIDKVKRKELLLNQKLFVIKVYNKDTYLKNELIKKIKNKTGIELTFLAKNVLWEFILENDKELPETQLQEALITDVLLTKSIEKGLIINPIFEAYEFVKKEVFYEFS
ncbi:MAG: hypothetical protein WC860_00365 [Candidatus Margulisiibacteriota bacterium]|jgi:hypothetical protein